MDYLSSILLGIVQGFTEFLPVSSSGHLVLVKSFLPFLTFPGVILETVLHMGTLFAILYFFRKEILSIKLNFLKIIIIGTIPAGIVGVLFSNSIELLFNSTRLVGYALLLTGLFNLLVDKIKTSKDEISVKDSLVIGVAQAFAIIPGISRSGSTIFWGVMKGIDRKKAASYSFLLSVPAVFGANILEFLKFRGSLGGLDFPALSLGFVAAFVSGVFAIKIVISWLEEGKFKYFAYYCFLIGLIAIFA